MPNQVEGMDALARAAIHMAVETSDNPANSEGIIKQNFEKDYLVLRSHKRSLQKQGIPTINQAEKDALSSRLSEIEHDPEELVLAKRLVDELTAGGVKDADFLRQQHGILGDQDYQDYLTVGWRVKIEEVQQKLEERRLEDRQKQEEMKKERELRNSPEDLAKIYTKGAVLEESSKKAIENSGKQVWEDVQKTDGDHEEYLKSVIYKENKTRLVDAWKKTVSEDAAEAIAENVLDVWFEVNSGNEKNKVTAATLMRPLAQLKESIQQGVGLDHQGDVVADVTVGKLIDEIGGRIEGNIDMEDVNSQIDQTRIDENFIQESEKRRQELIDGYQRFKTHVDAVVQSVTNIDDLKRIKDEVNIHLLKEDLPADEMLRKQAVLGKELSELFLAELGGESESYWITVLNEAYTRAKNPEAIKQLHANLEDTIKKLQQEDGQLRLGKELLIEELEEKGLLDEVVVERKKNGEAGRTQEFVETLVREVKKSHLMGKVTPRLLDVLPEGVSLNSFNQELMGLAVKFGVNVSEERVNLDWELAAEALSPEQGGEMRRMQQLGLQERGLEAYMFLPQTQEIMRFFRALPQSEQDQLSARLILKMIDGGRNAGMAQFELGAILGDEQTSPVMFAYAETMDWVRKAGEIKGYIEEKDVHRMFGFHNPESFALLNQKIDQTAWVKDKDSGNWIKKDFSLSVKDVLAEVYTYEAMRELAANAGLGPNSFAEAKGKWLKVAILRKLGYRREDVLKWFDQQAEYDRLVREGKQEEADAEEARWKDDRFPEIGRTDRLSLANQMEFDGLGGLAAVNWGAIITAYNYMVWSHGDIELAPGEAFKRKPDQRARGPEQDYQREFDKSVEVTQVMGMRPLLADYSSYVAREALVARIQNMIESENVPESILKRRKKYIEAVALVDQPTPEGIKVLSMMASGYGIFEPPKDIQLDQRVNYFKQKVRDGMKDVSTWGVKRVRPFHLWEKASTSEDSTMDELWAGFDAEPLMLETGMNEAEIQHCKQFDARGRTLPSGVDGTKNVVGWMNFLHYANFNLFDLSESTFKSLDSAVRYRDRAASTVSQMCDFAGLEMPVHDSVEFVPKSEAELSTYAQLMARQGKPPSKKEIEGYSKEPAADYAFYLGGHVKATVGKVVESAAKVSLGGFLQRIPTAMLYQEALRMHMEHNLFWHDDVPLYRIDIEEPDFGAGNARKLARFTEAEFNKLWLSKLGAGATQSHVDMIAEVLSGHMFHFVEPVENELKEQSGEERSQGRVLIGPNGSFLPIVATAKAIKKELRGGVEKVLEDISKPPSHDMKLKMNRFLKVLDEMDHLGGLSYAMLGGSGNMPVWGYLVDGLFSHVGGRDYPTAFEQQLKGELMYFLEKGMVMSPAIQGNYAVSFYRGSKGEALASVEEARKRSLR